MDRENIMNGPRNRKWKFKACTSDNEGTQTSNSGSPKKQKTWKTRRITLSIPTIPSHNPAVFQTPKQAISLTTLKSTRVLRMMLSPLHTRRQWSTALLKDALLITPCSNQVNL